MKESNLMDFLLNPKIELTMRQTDSDIAHYIICYIPIDLIDEFEGLFPELSPLRNIIIDVREDVEIRLTDILRALHIPHFPFTHSLMKAARELMEKRKEERCREEMFRLKKLRRCF